MGSLFSVLPPELQSIPALLAGFLALLGLVLSTAGVKVAKPMLAALVAGILAMTAASVLPPLVGLNPVAAAIIGLALGLAVGIVGFKIVQGVVLALCLGILTAGIFYQWQITHHAFPPMTNAPALTADSAAGRIIAGLPDNAQLLVKTEIARWYIIPTSLRQSMAVIGAGVAILAIFISWLLPRPTTWVMSALGGVALLTFGGMTLLNAYQPHLASQIPQDAPARLVIIGALAALGMIVQRLYFWPGKRQQQERAKDRPGEVAAA